MNLQISHRPPRESSQRPPVRRSAAKRRIATMRNQVKCMPDSVGFVGTFPAFNSIVMLLGGIRCGIETATHQTDIDNQMRKAEELLSSARSMQQWSAAQFREFYRAKGIEVPRNLGRPTLRRPKNNVNFSASEAANNDDALVVCEEVPEPPVTDTREVALVALRKLTARGPSASEQAYSDALDAQQQGQSPDVDPQRIVDAAGQAGAYDMSSEEDPSQDDDTE